MRVYFGKATDYNPNTRSGEDITMQLFVLSACIGLYLWASLGRYQTLLGQFHYPAWFLPVSGCLAVMVHGWLLYSWIDLAIGQNLTFFNMLSFILWLVSLWVLLAMIRKPTHNICLLVFPLAAISVVLVAIFPGRTILQTATNPRQLIHLLSAAAAFSVVCMAALQAILLRIQEGLLRRNYASKILQRMPPLETMEKLLFQLIILGFLLLTAVLISSLWLFRDFFAVAVPNVEKMAIAFTVWAIFAVLLVGRYLFGWRGRKVVYYTFSGFLMLMVLYFGSQFYFHI